MKNYKEKYLKYKNKYLKIKNKLNNSIGGELLFNNDKDYLVSNDNISNDYFLLDFHGATIPSETFIIPNNIILIISNCCGTSNSGENNIYVNPLDSNECLELNKEELLTKIVDGKIKLGNNKYFVVKPGTHMCEINLTLKPNETICSGYYKKNFNKDILYYELKPSIIVETFNNILIQTRDKNISYEGILYKGFLNFIKKHILSKNISRCLINSKIYLFLLNEFHKKLPIQNKFIVDDTTINKLREFLNDIIDSKINQEGTEFIGNIDGTFDWPINPDDGSSMYNHFEDTESKYMFSLFNNIIYKFFIFQGPTNLQLSKYLTFINKKTVDGKKSFVFLYSCQGNREMCSLDHCYRMITNKNRIRDTSVDKIFQLIKKGITVDTYSFIIIDTRLFNINLKKINEEFEEFGLNPEVLYYLICMIYDFINNRVNYSHPTHDEIILSNLVSHDLRPVKKSTIKNIYNYTNWKFLISSILININYTSNFKDIFSDFIGIIQYYIPNIRVLNLDEFLTAFHNNIEPIHKAIVQFVSTRSYEIPKSLINEKVLDYIFDDLIMLEKDKKSLNISNINGYISKFYEIYVNVKTPTKSKFNYLKLEEVCELTNLNSVKKIILEELIYIDNRFDFLKSKIKIKNLEKKELRTGAW
tara:strand:+ start:27 stop:1958 length:1932 start_codon:yes stop_codon:yes gene_type:complete